jgi:hypothetical protein
VDSVLALFLIFVIGIAAFGWGYLAGRHRRLTKINMRPAAGNQINPSEFGATRRERDPLCRTSSTSR